MQELSRPSTPNTVMYDDDLLKNMKSPRPTTGNSLAAPSPALYKSPVQDRAEDVRSVGGGRIWTIDGMDTDNMDMDEDEETRILLEKEFDDYYEDHVHKSGMSPMSSL